MTSRFSEADGKLAEDFLRALIEQGANKASISKILRSGASPVMHIVKAIAEAAKLKPETVAPHSGIQQGSLPWRTYNALFNRSDITTYGVLQCLSADDLNDNCRTIGPKMIGEVETYLAEYNCRLRGKREPAAERIKEVFGSVEAGPVILMSLMGWVNNTQFNNLCKQHNLKNLGDFRKIKRSAIEKTHEGAQPARLLEFLEKIGITLR